RNATAPAAIRTSRSKRTAFGSGDGSFMARWIPDLEDQFGLSHRMIVRVPLSAGRLSPRLGAAERRRAPRASLRSRIPAWRQPSPHQGLGGATPVEIYFGRIPSHLSA